MAARKGDRNFWFTTLPEPEKAVLLRRHPGVQVKVARTLGVSQGLVSRVWWGKAKSARILKAILKVVRP